MTIQQSDWRADLVSKYAALFQRCFAGRIFTPGRPRVGGGWRALVEDAVRDIGRAARGHPVKITEITCFSGSVRIVWTADAKLPAKVAAEIGRAVDLAAARSCFRCEICGEKGALWRCGVRLATACDEHGIGFPEAMSPGCENLHVILGFEEGVPAPIRYRRFLPHQDALVEIGPAQVCEPADAESRLVDPGSPHRRIASSSGPDNGPTP
jgi:hypothetical protein